MARIVYEFSKIDFKKHKSYIFQLVKKRNLTTVYHSHDFYEIAVILSGDCHQLINGKERAMKKNDVSILRPGDAHCFTEQSRETEVISLSVKKEELELISGIYDTALMQNLNQENEAPIFSLPDTSFFDEYSSDLPITEYALKLCLSYILKAYADSVRFEDKEQSLPRELGYAISRMKNAENLARGIPCLSELSHYSQSHLSRLIKRHFGMTPKQYINELRLTFAYNEIILTDKAPKLISESVGFSSFSHFNKIFKERFLITPTALRKHGCVRTA